MQAEKGDLNSMQITDVRVRKVTKEGKLKAVVSITIDNEFVVHDIKGDRRGKRLVYRNAEQKSSGWGISRYRTSDHSGTREKIQNTILDRYQESLEADTEESGEM